MELSGFVIYGKSPMATVRVCDCADAYLFLLYIV